MKIIEAKIIQFGKLKDRTFTFEDGFNIVKGDNESGKSTLLGFIKFALYGVGRKNPNVIVGERERALSWDSGIAAGSLTVEDVDGKKYRIERSGREGARGSFLDKARIIDLDNGEEVFEGEVPGEHFLGIGAQAYDSMCNIKQLETVAVGADAVRGVIDNLLSSGDENTNIQAAIKMLDAERRRLMHTNNKGGLVYESEIALDRLKSEHRGAVVLENERIKNSDELERVELALAKARDEHAMAQRMCDLYDDVLRLDKFDKLRELRAEEKKIEGRIANLEANAGFDTRCASYEVIAKIKSVIDSLTRSEAACSEAKNELDKAQREFAEVNIASSRGFAEIIDEFGTPKAAVAFLSAKKKKKSSSAVSAPIYLLFAAALLSFAGVLGFYMHIMAGAATVAFFGIALLVCSILCFSKHKSAKNEINVFMNKLGEGFSPKDEEKILRVLENFCETRFLRSGRANALESATFHMNMTEDNLASDREALVRFAVSLGMDEKNANKENLLSLGDKIRDYLEARALLDAEQREMHILIRALSGELERFSENDISARITPHIREKMGTLSFDKIKAERDAALQRANQFNQYKAGVERNLAAHETRRSANDIFPEIEAEQERLDSLKLRLDAVRLAMDTINSASMNMKSDITPRIRDNAQKNLATITDGKYSELYIDENMALSVFCDGATRPIDSLSKGSLDAAYFAVRLSLLQTLLKDKNPPLYMDECLSQLDDGRAENTIKTIDKYSGNSQCILFTCQSRDVELAKRVSQVNVIEL